MATELISVYYTPAEKLDTDYSTVSLQPLLIFQPHKKIQLFAGPRLQYQLPVYKQSNSYYQSFSKNMISLTEGSKDALHLGFSIGVNIF